MNRNHRAHLQSAVYLGLGVVAVAAGWRVTAEMPWWEALGAEPNGWWHLGALAIMGVAMLMKVTRPTAALIVGGLCVAAELSFGISIGMLMCLSDLIYNHGIRAQAHRARIGERTLTALAAALAVATAVFADGISALNMMLLSGAVLLLPLWWALEVRRGYPAFVEEEVKQRLEQERHADLLAEQRSRRRAAVESDRGRMARELHDVVSSQVSSIALTSGAVLNGDPDVERDRRALHMIRSTSVDALNELRQMVQVLRSEESDDAAELLTDTTWDEVLARAQTQGARVEVHGAPPEGLPETVRGVLLRILQESLRNTVKHGDGAAQVHLRRKRGALVLSVDSGLSRLQQQDPGGGAGTGLIAMRERAQAVNGQLRAGEHRGRWRVAADLPYQEVTHERAG